MPTAAPDLNGMLLVDKPGLPAPADNGGPPPDSPHLPTSHDIVQAVRRLSRQRRIGHTGTLDPMASGLLVLCLGWATRLVEYYQGHDKRYRAEVTLGHATDSYDALGAVVATAPVPALTARQIEDTLAAFRGEILQKPPAYSALKQGGESLHYKARRGEVVEIAARPVTFYAIEVLEFAPPGRLLLDVRCSAGAYIRSLAHDLGAALGTLGTLTALRRLAAGPFAVDQALALPDIEAAAAAGHLAGALLPPGAGLALPPIACDSEQARRFGQGQIVPVAESALPPGALARCVDAGGRLLGIVRRTDQESGGASTSWRAEKWFA